MNSSIFQNLKVVELASVLAGPSVGMFFSELGAKVVKIENKKTGGDVTRKWKLKQEDSNATTSAYFYSINWKKESIFLDLSDPIDHQKAIDLIVEADILIANFKSGSAAKLGLDYPALKQLNPSLIYANLTAYGETIEAPGFDVLLQAETGFLSMNGSLNGPTVKMPVALIDLMAGHQLKEGILVALLQRKETGIGSYVTVSLAQSAIASLANQASNWLNVGVIPQKMGSQHPNIAPYGDVFKTKDGKEIILAIGTEKQFKDLCGILEIKAVANDKEYCLNAQRVNNRIALVEVLKEAFVKFNQADLLKQFKEQKVPAGVIQNMQEVFEMPIAQEMVLEDEDGNKCVRTVVFEIT